MQARKLNACKNLHSLSVEMSNSVCMDFEHTCADASPHADNNYGKDFGLLGSPVVLPPSGGDPTPVMPGGCCDSSAAEEYIFTADVSNERALSGLAT